MRIVKNLQIPFIICLLVSVSQAFDICSDNKCKNGGQCRVLYNGVQECQCINGYKGPSCEKPSHCNLSECKNGATCIELDDGYRCQCLNGWDGEHCQNNIDDCASKPCLNGGFCKDLENHKFLCECLPNFIGMKCEHKDPCTEANPCGINGNCVSDNTGFYKCHCNKGFVGLACSIDVDECEQYSTGLCENGGKCINTVGSYRCECAKGYSGERCANDIIDCKNDTCKNGGTCLDKIGHYKCVCTENFKGTNCEIPIPICETRPCKNYGQCRDYGNDYFCICPKRWKGKSCEKHIGPCSENSCVNGGICEYDGMDNFKCVCKPGFIGKLCEHNINDCLGISCQNNGRCEDLINSWRCKCPLGFVGRYCEININECQSMPCKNNGKCVDLINDYKCICPSGLEGKNCEINKDECTHHPCFNGARCEDRVGGYSCHCLGGFVGLRCELKSDVCTQLSPCKHGVCRNEVTSQKGYVCICSKDMDSKDCSTEVSECKHVKCFNGGRCTHKNGEEKCICSSGFIGSQCKVEIDECRSNPCQHGGTCQDVINDYICYCPDGFSGRNCETNINECTNNPCSPNGVCIDEVNGYRCECFPPFMGPTCSLKLDPCSSNICSNDAVCIPNNDYKSYYCNCSSAYGRFAGQYCEEDINECLLNENNLKSYKLIKTSSSNKGPCLNMGTCINTKGSFICKCQSGFEGSQCEVNIDDCLNDPCKNGAKCKDLINGYKCHCQPGFTGENCEIEINECDINPCQNSVECKDHVNDYQCICKSGFYGKQCEINNDDCSEQSCSGHGTCVDKINSFECRCFSGYKGKYCEHIQQPCDINQCANNGSCINIITNSDKSNYLCNCRKGFSGPTCKVEIDLCQEISCGDHGLCSLEGEVFKCNCHKGYLGDRCEIHESDTCQTYATKKFNNASKIHDICSNSGVCFNQLQLHGFKCSCPSGYKGTFCEENIDDCANQPCQNGGECKDGIGMYSCKCPQGFQGVDCQVNWNDCSSEPCKLGQCIDQINNFTCICPRGVKGKLCDVVEDNCKNVKCLNGGNCRSVIGDFNCQCQKGFVGKYCETDLNECRYSLNGIMLYKNEKPYGPCSPSGSLTCLDSRGDFRCVCRPGFIGRYCEKQLDICEEIKQSGKLACFNSGYCVNQYDRLHSGNNSYRCLCPAGYGGNRCQMYNKKCQFNLCLNGGVCRPVENVDKMSFVCDCPKGVGGLFCEKDYVNECDTTLCYNGGECLDGFGKAICRCPQNFCGDMCEISDKIACNNSIVGPTLSYTEELNQCYRHLCNTKINNKRCDLECNNFACGFDSGECLHKVPKSVDGKSVTLAAPWSTCTIIKTKNIPCHHWFMNGRCDPQCNTEGCLFDGWDCEKPVDQCPNKEYCDKHYGDKHCQQRCNTLECDFDGGDCLQYDNSTISGAIVLVLPVSTTTFVNIWQDKLLQSLTHLLHSIVRVKKQDSGNPMIYPIRVFVEKVQDDTAKRHKRSVIELSNGKPGTKVYLEVDNSACKNTNKMCFDNSKSAAEFVSAALHSRLYRPPIPILSVQADSERRVPILPVNTPLRNMLIYIILVMTCVIVLGILIGVLYGFMQNRSKPDRSKVKKAETWLPEGMKRLNQSSSSYHHRRLNNNNRKRHQNELNGINFNSELGNLPQMTKSKISTTDSVDDSGSNSLTSTRITSYDVNIGDNNNETNNTSDHCMLLYNGDINCNFPPEKRLKLHMDSNKCFNDHQNLEVWCFNAFVHLLVSGNGLGEVNSNDGRDKQIIMEKIFQIALNHANHDNPNMFTDLPSKKELTNSSLTNIITSRIPYSGETLLHLAAKFNRKDAVKFLVEAGSDPNKDENTGRSCLLVAIDAGALEVVSYLLEQQHFTIDIHHKGPGGATGLIQAVKGAHLEIIHILLQHTQPEECDLNVTDDYARTALHWASATNQIGVVQLLLSYGLNRDAQDNEEMTPLYLASREGSIEVCKLLITNGANPDMSDHLDRLPRDIAKANNFDDVVDLLDDYINLSKENQQNRPMMWGQYSYYSNNYYCPSHHMDLKSVLYSSPHSLNQMSCCVFPNTITNDPERSTFYNTSLANVTHSNHPCYKENSTNYTNNSNNPFKKYGSSHSTNEVTNPGVKLSKHQNSPNYYKDHRSYFDYCANPNVHMMSNIKNFVVTNNAMLAAGGFNSNNNHTSSTSAPGITPSPDSDSPGHWSTSSPSLSPRSKNQQHLTKQLSQKVPIIQQIKPSVLHYHPTNDSGDLNNHASNLRNNEIYGFHSRNNLC